MKKYQVWTTLGIVILWGLSILAAYDFGQGVEKADRDEVGGYLKATQSIADKIQNQEIFAIEYAYIVNIKENHKHNMDLMNLIDAALSDDKITQKEYFAILGAQSSILKAEQKKRIKEVN